MKDIANQGVDQDGFVSSLGPREPELSAGAAESGIADYDKEEMQESFKEANGVDRATIENESLSVPTFDASHGDSMIGKKRSKDFPSKKRTVGSKRGKKNSFRRRKLHKKAVANRNEIEASADGKNETAAKNESSATIEGKEGSKDNGTIDGEAGKAALKETEDAKNVANDSNSADAGSKGDTEDKTNLKENQNGTAGANVTSSARTKIDPYSSIGSDTSSMESARNMKINIDKDGGSEASTSKDGAAEQQKKTKIHTSKSTDVHDDVISTEQEYKEADKGADNVPSEVKEGAAVKKHMTKQEMKSLESPVHQLVKSIFHKAASNVMKDFTKSNGLQNIAKMLVKAAVHNAMLTRPSIEKALNGSEKKGKKQNKKKKSKKTQTRTLKKLDAAKLVRDDLMAIGRHKIGKSKGKVAKKNEVKEK